jgi:imidazole glycerol-phosphate synthase subunit HisH
MLGGGIQVGKFDQKTFFTQDYGMIAIIDYNAGNIASVENALKSLGQEFVLTAGLEQIRSASHIILPGQGRAGQAIEQLANQNLIEVIKQAKQPFLGICLGMQILADYSQEDDTKCLGLVPGEVKKFSSGLKIPHMGWNNLHFEQESPLFAGIAQDSHFYFVHSYYYQTIPEYNLASAEYGQKFAAVVAKDNFFAVQFHPEKSGQMGLKMLANFCEM